MMEKFYKNEYLFSEIYLKEITEIEEDPGVIAALAALREYRDYASTSSIQEWNKTYIHEVLNALEFGLRKINDNIVLLYQLGNPNQIISICYSLLPSEDLNNTNLGKNWAEKIIRNLRDNRLTWGILTNGEKWRIYHTEEATPYENFLEIDLTNILISNEHSQFQIFHKFLKAENFVKKEDGLCLFDVFKKESQEKINYIEMELKKALKQKEEGGKGILSNLCIGYVEYLRKVGLFDFSDNNMRETIYGSAMLYMFRLLFLFYATARDLLAERDLTIFNSSLNAAEKICKHSLNRNDEYKLWEDLRDVFSNIDLTYNGGLFNPKENKFTEFIEENKISDVFLASVLFYMTYYEYENGNYFPISYQDMGVRHLGTLYEGLLEHKLFIAEEDTEVKVTGADIRFVPISEGGKRVQGKYIPAGQVYFGTDKKERKLSGSYYTPEYIVDYIVTNTVGKKLEGLRNKFCKDNDSLCKSLDSAINIREKNSLAGLLKANLVEFVSNEILTLSVLDPAMGSGHFLVNALNQISNFVTEFFNEFEIVSDYDTSVKNWRRIIVENCIYGVDINPLAVELANLSLWILSMTKDVPLSFLSHHLKQGDSLIGAKISDIGRYPHEKEIYDENQPHLFVENERFKEITQRVLKKYHNIESQSSNSIDNIEVKRRWLNEINTVLKPYKSILHYHLYVFYKNEIEKEEYENTLSSFNEEFCWVNGNFFHWELEFPEVFFESNGFDIVIGNPPYVNVKDVPYSISIKDTISTKNLFCYFSEIGFNLSKKGAFNSFIVPLSGFAMPQMKPFQELILNGSESLKIVNFSWRPGKIFDDANIPVSIYFAQKKVRNEEINNVRTTHYLRWYSDEKGAPLNKINFVDSKKYLYISPGYIPKIGCKIETNILDKMLKFPRLIDFITKKKKDTNNLIYYRSKGGLYYKIFTNFFAGSTNEISFSCINPDNNFVLIPVLNSNVFFWFYELFSSCRVVNFENISSFPFAFDNVHDSIRKKLLELGNILIEDIKRNATINVRNYSGFGPKECYTIHMRQSKKVLDEIDTVLGDYYGFTQNELNHLTNYMLNYRTDEG